MLSIALITSVIAFTLIDNAQPPFLILEYELSFTGKLPKNIICIYHLYFFCSPFPH